MTKTVQIMINQIAKTIPEAKCDYQNVSKTMTNVTHMIEVTFPNPRNVVSIAIEGTKVNWISFKAKNLDYYNFAIDNQQALKQVKQLMHIVKPYLKKQ